MGAACCIAAKDRTIISGPSRETLQRHAHRSPSWSFRWDNRGRVAGEDASACWLHGGGPANDGVEVKSSTTVRTTFASEEGSPLDSTQSIEWQNSPVSEQNLGILRNPSSSDHTSSLNTVEVKESMESPSISFPSPAKLSHSVPSVSSLSMSPLYYKNHLLPPNSTPSRWHHQSPGHCLLRQVSDNRIPEYKSPAYSISEDSLFPASALGNESTRISNGESLDSWSISASTELMTTQKERWSFDSDASSFSQEKISKRNSFDLQTCGICTKLLAERSSWGWSTQKIISTNELAVVSVLTCGHVYHAECLEHMTPEINKYDPACPVCTFGEKRTAKMSEKALKAKMDSKVRKKYKKCVVDGDPSCDIVFNHHKSSGAEDGRGLKMSSSLSMKSSQGKPFLRRHFSFGAKASGSSENQSTQRKGLLWAKSSAV